MRSRSRNRERSRSPVSSLDPPRSYKTSSGSHSRDSYYEQNNHSSSSSYGSSSKKTHSCDWTEILSSSGKRYFYNKKTAQSTWDKPRELEEWERRQPTPSSSSKYSSSSSDKYSTNHYRDKYNDSRNPKSYAYANDAYSTSSTSTKDRHRDPYSSSSNSGSRHLSPTYRSHNYQSRLSRTSSSRETYRSKTRELRDSRERERERDRDSEKRTLSSSSYSDGITKKHKHDNSTTTSSSNNHESHYNLYKKPEPPPPLPPPQTSSSSSSSQLKSSSSQSNNSTNNNNHSSNRNDYLPHEPQANKASSSSVNVNSNNHSHNNNHSHSERSKTNRLDSHSNHFGSSTNSLTDDPNHCESVAKAIAAVLSPGSDAASISPSSINKLKMLITQLASMPGCKIKPNATPEETLNLLKKAANLTQKSQPSSANNNSQASAPNSRHGHNSPRNSTPVNHQTATESYAGQTKNTNSSRSYSSYRNQMINSSDTIRQDLDQLSRKSIQSPGPSASESKNSNSSSRQQESASSSSGLSNISSVISSTVAQKSTTPNVSRFKHLTRDDLTSHVMGWQSEQIEKQAIQCAELTLHIGNHQLTQISADLKKARSIVRLTEIFSTLHKQRILKAGQLLRTVEEMKVKHCFNAS